MARWTRKSHPWSNTLRHPFGRVICVGALFLAIVLPLGFLRIPATDPQLLGFVYDLVAIVMAVYVVGKFTENKGLRDYGLNFNKLTLRDLLLGFLIGAGLMSLIILVMTELGWCRLGTLVHTGDAHRWFWLLCAFYAFGALGEELLFRGYLFHIFEDRWGTGAALALTMAMFGAMHLLEPAENVTARFAERGALFLGLELGLLLASCFLIRRSLWLPIGLHWAWNLFEGPVYGAHVSGADFGRPLLPAHFVGPTWMTGGYYGPEASVPALILGFGVGILLLRQAIRMGQWKSFADAGAMREVHSVTNT